MLIVSISLGTAIYTFFIMPDDVSSFDRGVTLLANMSVYLDDAYAGEIVHIPQGSAQFLYNFLGYSVSGLSNDKHVLSLSANNQVASSIIEFDYFIYTYVYYFLRLQVVIVANSTNCLMIHLQSRSIIRISGGHGQLGREWPHFYSESILRRI